MASTRSCFVLLGLLVVASSLCVTANAGRALAETSKLSLDVPSLLDELLGRKEPLNVRITIKVLKGVLGTVGMTLENAVGGPVTLPCEVGVVNKAKVVAVDVTVAGTLDIVLDVLGQKVHISLQLSALRPVLELVGDVVAVVLTLLEKVVNGVNVVEILNEVGDVLGTVTEAL